MQATAEIPQAYHAQKRQEDNCKESYILGFGGNSNSYIGRVNTFELPSIIQSLSTYNYGDDLNLIIPIKLSFLKQAFERSEYILALDDDWDDNGSKSYSIDTWSAAVRFIHKFATTIFNDFNKKIVPPKIYHGPNQSIDILIENEKYSLLINLPHNSTKAIYFGRDIDGNNSKGEINIDKINYALNPLAFNF